MNEPAFPCIPPVTGDGMSPASYPYPSPGMSLLDYFAGQAITGLLASAPSEFSKLNYVALAYEIANVMIAERNKWGQQ